MGKKATVVSLLQEILDILKKKPELYGPEPKPQPRVINDRFTDNGDGTITDKENKTLIIKDPSKIPGLEKVMTFKEATEACEKLSYGGYNSGWRIPTLKEEQSIRDYVRYNPAWNPDIFGGKFDDWYWSGEKCAWNSKEEQASLTNGSVWCVYSDSGRVSYYYKDSRGCVRPVRSCQ